MGKSEQDRSEQFATLFDSFYTHFVLRDLLAKIAPGATVLIAISITVADPGSVFSYLADLSFWAWIFLMAFSWIAGITIQAIGEKRGSIRYFPKELNSETYYEKVIKFERSASESEKRGFERFGVIKEACGNGHVAAWIVAILLIVNVFEMALRCCLFWKLLPLGPAFAITLFLLIVTLISIKYLGYMHDEHVQRQYEYMEQVLKEINKKKGGDKYGTD